MKAVKLDDGSTGICPANYCRKPAYPYGVYGADGHVDACEDHAQQVFDDYQSRESREDGCAFDTTDGRDY